MEKGEIAQNEQFHIFFTMFSMQSVSKNPLIATYQFSSAASLNLGWFQNGVLRNGLKHKTLKVGLKLVAIDLMFSNKKISKDFRIYKPRVQRIHLSAPPY